MALIPKTWLALSLPLMLAACGGAKQTENLDALDNELVAANSADPALMRALQDQIMVDPQLAAQSNKDAIRPPSSPYAAPMPATDVAANTDADEDGELMKTPAPRPCPQCAAVRDAVTLDQLAAGQKAGTACAAGLRYSARWAARMPNDLPLHPKARVSEAAGVDGAGCHLRVVSFSAPVPMQRMLDWYYTRASRGGFSAEHQANGDMHLLGGTRARDDAAYLLFLNPRGDGGTDVEYVVNSAK